MKIHFIQHVSYEDPGHLLEWAEKEKHEISFTRIYETAVFPSPDSIDMLVIMGGPMGVYEEEKYSWLKPEKAFIRAVIDAAKKVLGICLGSQLIAEVLGARVYPHTMKEIGWWPVNKVQGKEGDKLTRGLPDRFNSFHWHGDTFDLPSGAVHLFCTEPCAQQGYSWGNNVAALQFHPEITPALAEAMIAHGRDELEDAPFIQSETGMKNEIVSRSLEQKKYLTGFV